MKITKLTPRQARWFAARTAYTLGYARRIVEQIRATARAALEAIREFAEAWRRPPAAAAAPSRPAWMSPYGPPAPRHRR